MSVEGFDHREQEQIIQLGQELAKSFASFGEYDVYKNSNQAKTEIDGKRVDLKMDPEVYTPIIEQLAQTILDLAHRQFGADPHQLELLRFIYTPKAYADDTELEKVFLEYKEAFGSESYQEARALISKITYVIQASNPYINNIFTDKTPTVGKRNDLVASGIIVPFQGMISMTAHMMQ